MVTLRKGEMLSMTPKGERMVCEFLMPSRGIIGLRNQLLTATAGEAIMNHRFKEFQPFQWSNSWTKQWISYFNGKRKCNSLFIR